MAELHVEKKQKSSTMWIVIGIIVVAFIAWLVMRPSDDGTRTPGTTSGTTTGALPVIDKAVLAALASSGQHNLIKIG